MNARMVSFGEIEIDGQRYDHDLVIEAGEIRKRKKGPSKSFRNRYGHTPLSLREQLPWGRQRLIVGSGMHGALPVMDEVKREAEDRGIELLVLPTPDACELITTLPADEINAVLHVTC
jgi:hypothetical protein